MTPVPGLTTTISEVMRNSGVMGNRSPDCVFRNPGRSMSWMWVIPGLRKTQSGLQNRTEDPMACEDLVAQCFADPGAPLAVPELNRERALNYLACCYAQGLSWEDARRQIEECLQRQGLPREGIVRQLALAKPLLQ